METMSDILIIGLLRGGLYALMASGLTLVLGVMNISNFAHGELYMVGSYAAYFAYVGLGVPPLLALLIGALAAGAVGLLIERTAFTALRNMGREKWLTNSFLLTVGVSSILQYTAFVILGPTYKGVPSYWDGLIQLTSTVRIPFDRALAFATAIIAIAALWLFLTRTATGKAIRAVAEDETGAMLVGINIRKMYTLTFMLSCALAGVAGASLLPITPAQPFVGMAPLFKSYFVVILAGFGNVMGSVIGAFLIGLLETVTYYSFGAGWQNVVSLIVIMLIMLFKPAGLFGTTVEG